MRQFIFLSHTISQNTPGFGGKQGFDSKAMSSIDSGNSSNSQKWEISNHLGTHIDAPKHFTNDGRAIDTFAANELVFTNVALIDIEISPDELIDFSKFTGDIPRTCDLLLVRTKFENYRETSKFWEHNPGLHPSLAKDLRINFPHIRAIGFDFISASAFQNREAGRLAHREFLNDLRHPILLIEDMSLCSLTQSPSRVIVAPIRVVGSDGAPVTIFAECEV